MPNEEITLKDMFFAVLVRWRLCVVLALVFALLAGGYKLMSGTRDLADPAYLEEQQKNEQRAQDEYALRSQSLEADIANTEQKIEDQERYLRESVLMNLNPFANCVSRVELLVDTGYQIMPDKTYQNVDNTSAIVSAYARAAQSAELFSYINEQLGKSWQEEYVSELFSVGNQGYGVLSIEAYGATPEDSQGIAAAVQTYLTNLSPTLQQTMGAHSLTLTYSTHYTAVDDGLGNSRASKEDAVNRLKNDLADKQAKLAELKKPEPSAVTRAAVFKSAIKYGILGLLVGLVLAAGIAVVTRMMDSRIQREQDIRQAFQLRVLGTIVTHRDAKGV